MTTADIKQALATVRRSELVDASEHALKRDRARALIGRAWLCESIEAMIDRCQYDAAYWTVSDMIERDRFLQTSNEVSDQFIDDLYALAHLLDGARNGFLS